MKTNSTQCVSANQPNNLHPDVNAARPNRFLQYTTAGSLGVATYSANELRKKDTKITVQQSREIVKDFQRGELLREQAESFLDALGVESQLLDGGRYRVKPCWLEKRYHHYKQHGLPKKSSSGKPFASMSIGCQPHQAIPKRKEYGATVEVVATPCLASCSSANRASVFRLGLAFAAGCLIFKIIVVTKKLLKKYFHVRFPDWFDYCFS